MDPVPRAIRTGMGCGSLAIELYDLGKDVGEQRDVAADYPNVVEKLKTLMDQQHTPSGLCPLRPVDAPASKTRS